MSLFLTALSSRRLLNPAGAGLVLCHQSPGPLFSLYPQVFRRFLAAFRHVDILATIFPENGNPAKRDECRFLTLFPFAFAQTLKT